ncbi:hypothetical protein DYB32_000853 [Aphanomyces invadans]|uniref:Uncharacterized protein n=1 Tax=Aphanomyces invadans TaxID=157072 RepID=A0A3R6VTB8_9STRA|nr:hypothetical protein DYB32_000853 [Aphanomyces invadans]
MWAKAYVSDLLDKIKFTDPKHRSTLRDLAAATGIPKTVLYTRLKSAYFNFISSDLTVANMENYVHVDEKWFFLKVAKCTFTIPHAQKAKLERLGRLPEEPECDPAVVAVALARLDAEDEAAHVASAEEEEALVADEVALCGALEDFDIGGEDLTCLGFAMAIMETFDDQVVFEL